MLYNDLIKTAADTIQRLGAAAQDCKSCANLTLCNAYKDGDSFKGCKYKWTKADDICTELYYDKESFAPKLICKACEHEVPCITDYEGKVTQFDFCPFCGRKIKNGRIFKSDIEQELSCCVLRPGDDLKIELIGDEHNGINNL